MTRQEVYNYIVGQLAVPVTLIEKFLNSFSKVLDFITESAVTDIIPDWTSTLTFNTDGTGAGKYCKHPDTNGKKRLFETKTSLNTNNSPPTDPLITENTHWREISQSSGSAIKEWAAGIFGTGLVIVFHNHSIHGRGLCQLLDPARPFQSTNIETEITAGKWSFIAIAKDYVDAQILANINGIAWKKSVRARTTAALAANTVGGVNTTLTANANGAFPNQDGIAIALNDDVLVMNEAAQANNGIYTLTQVGSAGTPWILTRRGDANATAELQNAVVSVDQGTVHADTSWRQTTDTVVLGTSNIVWAAFTPAVPDATDTVKGIVELATTVEASTGTDTQRAVTPAGVKASIDANAGTNDTDVKYFEQWDWIGSVAGGSNNIALGWSVLTAGTGAGWAFTQYGSDNTERAIGALEVQTGTTATGMSVLAKGSSSFSFGRGNTLKLRMRSALKNLSDAVERFTVYQGFGESIGSVEHNFGAYFRYNDSVNAGRWQAVTRQGGVETATDTGVAADLLFSIFEIRVNSDATSVGFYINGTLVATHATNIPNGVSDYVGLNFKILKALGTTNRNFVMDWYDFLITRTTAR